MCLKSFFLRHVNFFCFFYLNNLYIYIYIYYFVVLIFYLYFFESYKNYKDSIQYYKY